MSTYIVLVQFTQQGVQTIKNARARADAAKQAVRAAGGEWKALYYTMGQYDAVGIVDMPDDETMSRVLLAIGMAGNIRTQTLRAFKDEDFFKIAAKLA